MRHVIPTPIYFPRHPRLPFDLKIIADAGRAEKTCAYLIKYAQAEEVQ